jgi:hypothetical protein
MLHLYNRDTVTYPTKWFSVRRIVSSIRAKGYTVVVRHYPDNATKSITYDNRPIAVVIGNVLLLICPPLPPKKKRWSR